MAETPNTSDIKDEIRNARANLHRDFDELDHHLHVDVPETFADQVPLIAAGAAALAAVIGFGGTKALKYLAAFGIAAGAAYYVVQQRQRD